MEIDVAWISRNLGQIGERTWQHLILTVVPLTIGFAISLVLAIWAMRRPRVYGPITAVTGSVYTIPSLAAVNPSCMAPLGSDSTSDRRSSTSAPTIPAKTKASNPP